MSLMSISMIIATYLNDAHDAVCADLFQGMRCEQDEFEYGKNPRTVIQSAENTYVLETRVNGAAEIEHVITVEKKEAA